MIIKRDIIFSIAISITKDEISQLYGLLDEFEDGSLIIDGDSCVAFYSGLIPFLKKCGMEIRFAEDVAEVQLSTLPDIKESMLSGCTLRDYQIAAVRKAIYFGRGIIQSPTGSGKTVIAGASIVYLFEAGLASRALYLCPQGFIAEQTAGKFKKWGLSEVCMVGYGHRYEPNHKIYICVVDSAYKRIREESTDLEKVDLIILDECHHAKASRWQYICEKLRAPRRLAFTATAFEDPKRYCRDDLVLQGLTGPIIFNISSKALRDQGYLAHPIVCMLRPMSGDIPVWSWNAVYKTGIVGNKKRNSLIVSIAKSCYISNYRTMIFVGQVKHGERIAEELARNQGVECAMVQGNKKASIWKPSGSTKRYKWSVDEVAAYINNRSQAVMIATCCLDEGFDIPTVNVLIMATAMKKYRRTIQRAGRGMRPKVGDNRVFIFDFYDDNHIFLENHSKDRMWTYGVEEFQFVDSLEDMESFMQINIDLDRSLIYKSEKVAKFEKSNKKKR